MYAGVACAYAVYGRHMIALVRSIGRHLDDIVVDSADTARTCIKYLRDQVSNNDLVVNLIYCIYSSYVC